ncbi:hypothetical protein OG943_23750 [Amycolatopsis sp. NBC_00345]|uniref:hypothetical protein n=1 Tax=Amycolatopsis sp. NBC_00345 TaxID=2975955 RepID=UPI002E270D78
MTAGWDGFGTQWVIDPEAELTVEETGSDPRYPPMLILVSAQCVVMLRPPDDPAGWLAAMRFLRLLRDGAEELAGLLEERGAARRVCNG